MDPWDHTWSCILQEVEQDLTWLCGSWARFAPSPAAALMPVLSWGSETKENASSMQPVGFTDGQSEPQSIQPSFLFDPITSPLFGSVLVLTVLLVQPKVKDNCLWSSSWDGTCFCSTHLTPPPGKTLDLVRISKHVLNFM